MLTGFNKHHSLMTMVRTVSDKNRKPRKDIFFFFNLEGKKPKDGIEVILIFFFHLGTW